jgi:hypothetical protein
LSTACLEYFKSIVIYFLPKVSNRSLRKKSQIERLNFFSLMHNK